MNFNLGQNSFIAEFPTTEPSFTDPVSPPKEPKKVIDKPVEQ